MTNLRPGYKRTEVGVIPKEWDVVPLRKLIGSLDAGVSVRSVPSDDVAVAHNEYILKTSCVSGGEFFPTEAKRILPQDLDRARTPVRGNALIISRMNTPALVGEVGYVASDHANLFLPDRLWMALPAPEPRVSMRWLSAVLAHGASGQALKGTATGTSGSMKNIAKPALQAIAVPYPKPYEQQAIAEALSDTDGLIAILEALIAKKRDIKQGAMQELLTGQSPIRKKRLGEVLRVEHGKSQKAVEARDGAYPILASGGQIGTAASFLHDKPSVLIGRKGTIDKPMYIDVPFWTIDTLFYTVIFEPNSPKYLFYQFCMINWRQYNEASGVPSLNAATIEHVEIPLHSPDEQRAIATVLSDMDAEIKALEDKLAKARAVKQGMMQVLLTGEVRLI